MSFNVKDLQINLGEKDTAERDEVSDGTCVCSWVAPSPDMPADRETLRKHLRQALQTES